MPSDRRHSTRPVAVALAATRVALPLAMGVAGIAAVIVAGGSGSLTGAGVVLAGFGLMVWMINWLFRMSVASNRDREREEEAREYFDRHGRWPGE
jgi:small neutral amino acid transporter SnatA (MarC family)